GLPDYGRGASVHSVSNHRRDDRGLPGCPAIRLLAYRPLCRLGLSLEDSPIPVRSNVRRGRFAANLRSVGRRKLQRTGMSALLPPSLRDYHRAVSPSERRLFNALE
ncbi:MAG: hypothetical protein ABSD29_22185, partial [Verrucomicrobiota bacterium]